MRAIESDPLAKTAPLIDEDFLAQARRAMRVTTYPDHAAAETAMRALADDVEANKSSMAQILKIGTHADDVLRRPDGSVIKIEAGTDYAA